MTTDMPGRIVAITGASRGIGGILAQAFAKDGATLALLARDGAALQELAAAVPTEALPVPCDVSEPQQLDDAFRAVAEKFGRVDSVVINAGISPASHRAQNLPTKLWQDVLDVNLTGAFLTAQAAHEHLIRSYSARVVLLSSVMARSPRPGLSAYAASKAGIEGLTRALAADWARDRICVNAVAPGFFDAGLGVPFAKSDRLRNQVTSKTALGRMGRATELAQAVMFLAGDDSSYLTGQVLSVDGGYGLAG